jgi:hypothetical protein
MSRSGTSAVAQMFIAAGCHAGPDGELIAANHANPRGYFERREIVELNDEILRDAGATWFRPPRVDSGWELGALDRSRAAAAFERLLGEAGGVPVVLKDPRIGVLLDLWRPLVEGRLATVLVIRDPLDVALSLSKRDGSPLPFALAAWELHMAELLRRFHCARVTIAPYAALGTARAADRVLSDALAFLKPDLRGVLDPAAAAAAFEPSPARDGAASRSVHADTLTPRQLELWRWLEMLRPGAQTLDVPAELLGERPAAWTLVDAELGRRESVERIAVLEKLRAADAQEIARLQALVHSEQTRLQAEVDTARDAVRQQEVRHEHEIASLRALLRSEQARLHAELDEIRSISDLAGGHEEP